MIVSSFDDLGETYDDFDYAVFTKWMGGDDRFQISGWGWTVQPCDHEECIIRRTHET